MLTSSHALLSKSMQMVKPGTFLLNLSCKKGRMSCFDGPLSPDNTHVGIRINPPAVYQFGGYNKELFQFLEEKLTWAFLKGEYDEANGDSSDDSRKRRSHSSNYDNDSDGNSNNKALSRQVQVTLHSGQTSKEKVVTVQVPCDNVDDAWALLVKASLHSDVLMSGK